MDNQEHWIKMGMSMVLVLSLNSKPMIIWEIDTLIHRGNGVEFVLYFLDHYSERKGMEFCKGVNLNQKVSKIFPKGLYVLQLPVKGTHFKSG